MVVVFLSFFEGTTKAMPLFLLDEEKQKVSTEPVFLVETK
jgi:hypothetical protein